MTRLKELPPISTDDAARFLAISSRSVRRLVDRGALRPTKIGACTAFRWLDVLRCAGIDAEATASEPPAPLMTPHDAADFLGCAPATVRGLIAAGELRPVRLGGVVRLREQDVASLAEMGRPDAPSA